MTLNQIRQAIKAYYCDQSVKLRREVSWDGSIVLLIYKRTGKNLWLYACSVDEFVRRHCFGLLVRDGVETIQYHRPPTASEIRFGEGAVHYAPFNVEDCCWEGTRIAKQWFVSPYDGLKYYR
jgi:hypothetical protein